jgi:hypothetical protein
MDDLPPLDVRLRIAERAIERARRRKGQTVTVRLQRPRAGRDDAPGPAELEGRAPGADQVDAGVEVVAMPALDDHGVE